MVSSKIFSLLLIGASLVYCWDEDEIMKKFSESFEACGDENNFTGTLKNINFDEDAPQNVKCFLACILMREEVMLNDGSLDLDAGKSKMKEMLEDNSEMFEKVIKALVKCVEEVKPRDDKCETAFEFMKCKMGELTESD